MAPERKKSQTKFGISPFIFSQMLPTHNPNSMSDVSNVFIVSSLSPAPNPRKKGEGVGGGNQCHTDVFIPSCLDKRLLSSIVHIFQTESLHAQECHMAVRSGLLFCCPFYVKPKLLFSDVKLDRCVFGQPAHWKHMADWSSWSPWPNHSQWHWWNDSAISQEAPGSLWGGDRVRWVWCRVRTILRRAEREEKLQWGLTSSWHLGMLPLDLICFFVWLFFLAGKLGWVFILSYNRGLQHLVLLNSLFLVCTHR